jgi:CO/xanthine dehydrogenase Mo-binding subunit
VLELAAAKAEWSKPPPPGVFRGIAHTKAFRSHCAQVAEVVVDGPSVRVKRVVAAVDCGFVVNPDIVRAQVEGAIAFGLSAALYQAVTLEHGRVVETNFHQQKVLRMHEMPVVEVHLVDSHEPPTGIGEPGLPPIAPAVANAIFAATGKRLRRMPLLAALNEVKP